MEITSPGFKLVGESILRPEEELGIARCKLAVASGPKEARGEIKVTVRGEEATAELESTAPLGANLEIRLEDIDLQNQRHRWRQNVLEIAARHPSLKRYLGPKEKDFPGQESKHFRLVLAEIVADAVCARLLERQQQAQPGDFEDADWSMFYADYSRLMTQFLPIAHRLVLPSGGYSD